MMAPARVGQRLEDVDTPALVLELDAFEKNLRTLADAVRGRGVRVRTHAKTHKCPEVARRQMALGAVGACCQKVSEADFATLKSHGFTEEDIWDVAAISAFFGMSNRLANVTSMRPNAEFYTMGRG